MKKWLKILLGIILALCLVVLTLQHIYLTPDYLPEPILTGEFSTTTIESSGQSRTFHWYAPKGIEGNMIIFVLHGSTGRGREVREQTA